MEYSDYVFKEGFEEAKLHFMKEIHTKNLEDIKSELR